MNPPKLAGAQRGTAEIKLGDSALQITVRAQPLPMELKSFLVEQAASIRQFALSFGEDPAQSAIEDSAAADAVTQPEINMTAALPEAQIFEKIKNLLAEAGGDWSSYLPTLRAFGPRGIGPNLLFDRTDGEPNQYAFCLKSVLINFDWFFSLRRQVLKHLEQANSAGADATGLRSFYDGLDTAFQLATLKGPLCSEPMQGLAFFIEKITFDASVDSRFLLIIFPAVVNYNLADSRLSQIAGSLISAGQEAFRNAFLDWSPRLLLAMYSCDIQASSECLAVQVVLVSNSTGV